MHSVVERHLACLAQTPPPKLPRRSIKRRLVHMKKEDPGGQPMSHLLPYNQKEGKKTRADASGLPPPAPPSPRGVSKLGTATSHRPPMPMLPR